MRPYELEPGSTDALHAKWRKICIASLTKKGFGFGEYKQNIRQMVKEFDTLPLRDIPRKNRVGIVGEILVKYMPLANNDLVRVLEREGAEAVVPELLGFMEYCFENGGYSRRSISAAAKRLPSSPNWASRSWNGCASPPPRPLPREAGFCTAGVDIKTLRSCAEPYLSAGNQCGEGWFLAGEMVELVRSGTPNIVCVQPFGCLPNHIVGKGVMRGIQRGDYPQANMIAVDYDPGASEVNQLNRIKLMLTAAARGERSVPEVILPGPIGGCSGSCSDCAAGCQETAAASSVRGKYDLW